MTQDEFLALVEKHPLPWTVVGGYAGFDYASDPQEGRFVTHGEPLARRLADAAPALAAAAIRLLRADPHKWDKYADEFACVFCDQPRRDPHAPTCEWLALRAALPEALRS